MRSALWALVAASILWGTTGTAASFVDDGVSPVAIGAATMAIGGALLLSISARGAVAAVRRPDARRWLLIGAVGVVVYPLAFYSAMDLAGVAIGNVVALGSGPLFAALLERVIDGRRLTTRWMLGASAGIVGVALLVVGGHGGAGAADASAVPLGVALGLVAGGAYALYTFASGRVIGLGVSSRSTMGAVFGLGAIPLAIVLLATGAPILESPQNVAIIGYLAVGPMFLAYVLFGWGLRSIRSSTVTVVTLLEPLVATILAVLIVGERLDALGWVGLVLILLGVTVVSTARRPVPAP
ncbi:MAG: EamA family transporter [Microcella sp.]|uniref:DMT family transporter n=1 Tax=Microcella sp. TaxID=1913979 RepID=UPI00271B3C9B|nr:EamA family transporter [Microcella sp.]MDO8337060.1 EamA family transporter [Microcella sp.]